MRRPTRLLRLLAALSILAGMLAFPVYICVSAYREHARLAASPVYGPNDPLTRAAAMDASGVCAPRTLGGLLLDRQVLAVIVGPPVMLYVLGWVLIAPAVWIVRGFRRPVPDSKV